MAELPGQVILSEDAASVIMQAIRQLRMDNDYDTTPKGSMCFSLACEAEAALLGSPTNLPAEWPYKAASALTKRREDVQFDAAIEEGIALLRASQ